MFTCPQCGSELPMDSAPCPKCTQSPGTEAKRASEEKVSILKPLLTVVGLAALLVVVGFIAVVAVDLFSSRGGNRMARARGEVRSIATALQAYSTDAQGFPMQDKLGAVASLRKDIEPDYIKVLPLESPWGGEYLYLTFRDEAAKGIDSVPKDLATDFLVISTGKDRALDRETVELLKPGPDGKAAIWTEQPKGTSCYESDIIWLDDGYLRQPEGPQRKCGPQG